jgi:Reverse transcriptase (RNA-dependent DNA polymerase)
VMHCDVVYLIAPSARPHQPTEADAPAEALNFKENAVLGMHVGYSSDGPTTYYLVYDPVRGKVVKTRDAEHHEGEFTVAHKLRKTMGSDAEKEFASVIMNGFEDISSDVSTPSVVGRPAVNVDVENEAPATAANVGRSAMNVVDDAAAAPSTVQNVEHDDANDAKERAEAAPLPAQRAPRQRRALPPPREQPHRAAKDHAMSKRDGTVNYERTDLFGVAAALEPTDADVNGKMGDDDDPDFALLAALADEADHIYLALPEHFRVRGRKHEELVLRMRKSAYKSGALGDRETGRADEERAQQAVTHEQSTAARLRAMRAAMDDETPMTYAQAMASSHAAEWHGSAVAELQSHKELGTFTLVPRERGMNVLPTRWVFKVKRDESGNVTKYKARITPKGFRQRHGVDYHETFAPVMRYASIRTLLAEAARTDLEVKQGDVGTAFLRASVAEDIFIAQPEGFVSFGANGEELVWKLEKAVYGIKQAPRVWFKLLNDVMVNELHMVPCKSEPSVYSRRTQSGGRIVLAVWVDDIWAFYAKRDEEDFRRMEKKLVDRFEMARFKDLHAVLGIRVRRDRANRTLTLDQEAFTEELLEKMGMQECAPMPTPTVNKDLSKRHSALPSEANSARVSAYREGVGGLMWLATQTRPDIAFPVGVLARFMQAPGDEHWRNLKRVLRYLRGTSTVKLQLGGRTGVDRKACTLEAFCDADWAADLDNRRSTTGFVLLFNGSIVCWASKKQNTVALSTVEAEYMGISAAAQEIRWLKQFASELGMTVEEPTVLHTDNQTARTLASGELSVGQRTKHIDIRYHFVREMVEAKDLDVKWIPGEGQLADLLTKCLPKARFVDLRERVVRV